MNGLYLIPGLRKQIEEMGSGFFRIKEIAEPETRRSEDCVKTRYFIRINGIKATIEEKRGNGIHWLEYRGSIPNKRIPGTLTFFSRRLKAYECDGSWVKTDKYDHVIFP